MPFKPNYLLPIAWIATILAINAAVGNTQKDYYLEHEIQHFEIDHLDVYLFRTVLFVSPLVAVTVFLRTKSTSEPFIYGLLTLITLSVAALLFHDTLLNFFLYTNRQFNTKNISKQYMIHFDPVDSHEKKEMTLMEVPTHNDLREEKIINYVYRNSLKQNDEIILPMKRGLWGLEFKETPFNAAK